MNVPLQQQLITSHSIKIYDGRADWLRSRFIVTCPEILTNIYSLRQCRAVLLWTRCGVWFVTRSTNLISRTGLFSFFYFQKSGKKELGNWGTISIGPYQHTVLSWWDDELKKLGEILTQSCNWKLWPFPTVRAIKKWQLLGIKRGKKCPSF